ncbi:Clavaminate synthase-like protein [Lenzites betulinus]|nr:Clavaminate synthase-like protein [Lenzites betulinus]
MEVRCDRLDTPSHYKEFFEHYLLPNLPVIFGPSLITSWHAYAYWRSNDEKINWEHLASDYGHLEVTVADCATREFSDQRREQMLFRDVVALWETGQGQSLYVKDWHLARTLATSPSPTSPHAEVYTTPDVFRDDWMNAYYSAHTEDDFRFVYVGASGTFTPLHRDVYTSYSWSTNVCGRKRWWLFPPEQTPLLFRRGGEEHAETAFDVRDVDPQTYPSFAQARPIVVEQNSGETIFVPSGWYHQVENLTDCISINHNWCNAVNLPSLYASMCAKVQEVEHALEDVQELLSQGGAPEAEWQREWVAIVQDVVEKDAGWNWATFWRMVRHALYLASGKPCAVNETLWPRTPLEFTAPLEFIMERVTACYEDFKTRSRGEEQYLPGLEEVLMDVRKLLDD